MIRAISIKTIFMFLYGGEMELIIRDSNFSAGLPVAVISKRIAKHLGVHPGDRISLKTYSNNPKEVSTIVDISKRNSEKEEIFVTEEIKKILSARDGEKVEVGLSPSTQSLVFIKEKLMGRRLEKNEIRQIIKDVVNNVLSEAEISVFIAAMFSKGMVFEETKHLIDAILFSGNKMSFKNKFVVDKHCIGGIPGNRTTPIVVSICAAAGRIFPKTSSRAITSAAGTADCIEVLSPVEFSMEKLKKIVQKTNACLSWGGALGMAPADSKIIQIEKMLKIDPEAQLLASIMAKKLAAGSKYILIDIPYGNKAKVSKSRAKKLRKKFLNLGESFGIKIKVVLTSAREPIGNGIGPALEMRDILRVLRRDPNGPKDLEKKSLFLAAEILEMTGTKKGEGEALARKILESGEAYKKFNEIIKAQGGKIKEIVPLKIKKDIFATKNGRIKKIDNKEINNLARVAGCPTSKYSGIYLYFHVGDKIQRAEKILTIYSESRTRLKEAINYFEEKKPIKL